MGCSWQQVSNVTFLVTSGVPAAATMELALSRARGTAATVAPEAESRSTHTSAAIAAPEVGMSSLLHASVASLFLFLLAL